MHSRILNVIAIFAAFMVTSVIPRGAFGEFAYDVAGRAAVAGAVAALTGWLFMTLSKQGRAK